MSVPVDVDKLAHELDKYQFAYLMTVGAQASPHAVAVSPELIRGELTIVDAGRRTRTNAQERTDVALVWPPRVMTDYSLIVDGISRVEGDTVVIQPTRAVLHRPAPQAQSATPQAFESRSADTGDSCQSDCVELS